MCARTVATGAKSGCWYDLQVSPSRSERVIAHMAAVLRVRRAAHLSEIPAVLAAMSKEALLDAAAAFMVR
jgi:hypothetical protein